MTTNKGNGRTAQDIKRDFESSKEFGRVIEAPVVKSEVKPVKVKKQMSTFRADHVVSLVVSSFATLLTISVIGAIVDNNIDFPDSPSEALLEVVLYN